MISKVTPAMIERMQELRAMGWSHASIAKDVGVGRETVRLILLTSYQRAAAREASNTRSRKERQLHPERVRSRVRKSMRKQDAGKKRQASRKYSAKIWAQYTQLRHHQWVMQSGRCLGCWEVLPWRRARMDHDHRCCDTSPNKACGLCYRGIVCPSCNRRDVLAQ